MDVGLPRWNQIIARIAAMTRTFMAIQPSTWTPRE
jgi:hypothetical protein